MKKLLIVTVLLAGTLSLGPAIPAWGAVQAKGHQALPAARNVPVSPAAKPAAQIDPSLTLSVSPQASDPAVLALTAHLAPGPAATGERVSFFVVTTEFGSRQLAPIGTAGVAPGGTAEVAYEPTWSGNQEFVAVLGGGAGSTTRASATHGLTASTWYQVTHSQPGKLYATANLARPLSTVGRVFVGVLLLIVALVWLTLLATLIRVARRLPRLAEEDNPNTGVA